MGTIARWSPWAIGLSKMLHSRSAHGLQGEDAPPRGIDLELAGRSLRIPFDHALPKHLRRWPLYGRPLALVAEAILGSKGSLCAIDVGANVGDTAAILSQGGAADVLCVEGDPLYWPFLAHNARQMGTKIQLEFGFVGTEAGNIDSRELRRRSGTTSFNPLLPWTPRAGARPQVSVMHPTVDSAGPRSPILRLEDILEKHPPFLRPDLVKIDTDGQDFPILLAHLSLWESTQAALFFEYDVNCGRDGMTYSCQCIEALHALGYAQFVVFDNFGNYLMTTDSPRPFADLNIFLRSNARHAPAVYYFDVCAIPVRMAHLAIAIRARCEELIRLVP